MYLKNEGRAALPPRARRVGPGEARGGPGPARGMPGFTPPFPHHRFHVLFGSNRLSPLLQIRWRVTRRERTGRQAGNLKGSPPQDLREHASPGGPSAGPGVALASAQPSNYTGRLRPPGYTIATAMKQPLQAGGGLLRPWSVLERIMEDKLIADVNTWEIEEQKRNRCVAS